MFENRYELVNIGSFDKVFKAGEEVTPEILKKKNLVKKLGKVKVLGNGEIKTALKISAHAFSASAKAAIEKAGGSVTVIEKKAK